MMMMMMMRGCIKHHTRIWWNPGWCWFSVSETGRNPLTGLDHCNRELAKLLSNSSYSIQVQNVDYLRCLATEAVMMIKIPLLKGRVFKDSFAGGCRSQTMNLTSKTPTNQILDRYKGRKHVKKQQKIAARLSCQDRLPSLHQNCQHVAMKENCSKNVAHGDYKCSRVQDDYQRGLVADVNVKKVWKIKETLRWETGEIMMITAAMVTITGGSLCHRGQIAQCSCCLPHLRGSFSSKSSRFSPAYFFMPFY